MRCSSCESLLDSYVDATLKVAQMRAVASHLSGCTACTKLHRELRVVDGLFATVPRVELPANFETTVMSAVRALPVPKARTRPVLFALSAYLVAAWAVAAALLSARAHWSFWDTLAGGAHNALAMAQAFLHAFAPIGGIAVFGGASLLAVDVLLLAAIFVFYRTVRPQLAARLAPIREVP